MPEDMPEETSADMTGHITDQALLDLFSTARTIAVVGLSADSHRPSYFAARYMQTHGYRIVPINPRYSTVLDETCYPSLDALPATLAGQIDIVDVFRRTEDVMPIAHQAVAIGAKALWQQLGVVDREAHALVRSHGLASIMDRCVKIEYARLFGGLNWFGVNTKVISARRPRWLP